MRCLWNDGEILKYQERIQCELVSKLRDSSALPKGLTRGFCPGENGWDLAQQQIVIGLVDAAGIGVSLSSYSIMTPSKTISVVYGIGNGIYEGGHSCDHCTMNACTLRR